MVEAEAICVEAEAVDETAASTSLESMDDCIADCVHSQQINNMLLFFIPTKYSIPVEYLSTAGSYAN